MAVARVRALRLLLSQRAALVAVAVRWRQSSCLRRSFLTRLVFRLARVASGPRPALLALRETMAARVARLQSSHRGIRVLEGFRHFCLSAAVFLVAAGKSQRPRLWQALVHLLTLAAPQMCLALDIR